MTDSPPAASARQLLLSRIAVLTLAVVSGLYSLHTTLVFSWIAPAAFGIGIDPSTAIVNYLAPSDAAKGIRLGDRVDLAAMSFRERSFLYENEAQPAGWRMTIRAIHGNQSRTATFETANSPQDFDLGLFYFSRKVVDVLFIVTGVILVWRRPSIMLWGLALFLITLHEYLLGPFVSPAVAALLIFGFAVINALALPGLIVFAARFPDGRASRATRYFDCIAAAFFLYYIYLGLHDFIPLFTSRPIGILPGDSLFDIFDILETGAYTLVFVALCVKARQRHRSTRAGFGWIAAGYGVGIVFAGIGLTYLFAAVHFDTSWPLLGQELLMLALPISVAYSIIRYRTFGLGLLANRTLVYSALTVIAVAAFAVGVWLASRQNPTTPGIAGAMCIALLVGMGFRAQQSRVVRLVDRIFLPHRYEAAVSLDRIRETWRGTGDVKRLADEIVASLGLASIAVFARTNDGGFVRRAACGWPCGTSWHLLPDETLTTALEGRGPLIALTDDVDDDLTLPAASARPCVALTLRRSGRVERAIFVGSHRDGSKLDRDVLRALRDAFDDAVVA